MYMGYKVVYRVFSQLDIPPFISYIQGICTDKHNVVALFVFVCEMFVKLIETISKAAREKV